MDILVVFLILFAISFAIVYGILRKTLGSWYAENRQFLDEVVGSDSWQEALKKRLEFERTLTMWGLGIAFVVSLILFVIFLNFSDGVSKKQHVERHQLRTVETTSPIQGYEPSNTKVHTRDIEKEKPAQDTEREKLSEDTEKEQLSHQSDYRTAHLENQPQTIIPEEEEQIIRNVVIDYHNTVAEERIDDALDFYVSYRKPQIKIHKLRQIAEGTEYYVVERVRVLNYYEEEDRAEVYVRVRQKPVHSSKEQVWEGVWIMEKEYGEWKIVKTPGRRIK